jgi:cell division protein FtsA
LESKVHLVTIARNIEKDLVTCMDTCGIEIDGFVLEPLASSYSVLDANERNLGTVLIDIGGGTSDIIIYQNNAILHTGAIPLGGESITKDIAYALETSLEQAEEIKCKYGTAKSTLANNEEEELIIHWDCQGIGWNQKYI